MAICSKGTTECRHSNNRLEDQIAVLSHFSPKVEDFLKRKKKAAFDIGGAIDQPQQPTSSKKRNNIDINKEDDGASSVHEAFGMDNYRAGSPTRNKHSLTLVVPENDKFSLSGYGALAQRGEMTNAEKA